MRAKLLLVASALGAMIACDDVLLGEEGTFTANCDRDPPLTYESFGKGYVGKWCTGCHSAYIRENQRNDAPLDVNLDTYEDVQRWADRIWARSVDTSGMPPGGGASEAETGALAEWLRCDVYPELQRRGDGS